MSMPFPPASPLRVFVAGASGTLGRRLCLALVARGHRVAGLARHLPATLIEAGVEPVVDDVATWSPRQWRTALRDADVVVNAIGIFREAPGQRFETLHGRLPRALFDAARQAGVRLAVQISALGADEQADTAYHLSKREADRWLLAQPLPAVVVQPSLLFAPDGPSARLFLGLASLPVLALPDGGRQPLQPIHVDDGVAALVALIEDPQPWIGRRVALVGAEPISLRAYLGGLRAAMGLRRAWTVSVPAPLAAWGAALAGRLPGSLLTRDSWRMLQRGNTADASDTVALLGASPRPPERFLDPGDAPALRWRAQWGWLSWLVRLSLAFVWIFTAIVSAFVYPVADSLALLAAVGVPAPWRELALSGASMLDLVLGLATLFAPRRWRLAVWWSQAALMLFYTVVLTVFLPAFWWHPYGPLSKNLPMLAALALLIADDSARRPSRRR